MTEPTPTYEHIVYFSNHTNNTHRFATKLQKQLANTGHHITLHRIPTTPTDKPLNIHNNYILITPSYGTTRNNHVPPQVKSFLNNPTNREHCTGIIGSGNLNFGKEYAAAGHVLSKKLGQPLLHTFELAGFDTDLDRVAHLITTRALNRHLQPIQ